MKRTEGREDRVLIYATIRTNGWKLVAPVSQAEIAHRAVTLNQWTGIAALAGITLMFLVLCLVLLTFVIQRMQRRVQLIIRMIRREGIGWLEERRFMPDGDFRLLERSVDHLIHRLNGLMEEAYRARGRSARRS